MDLGLEGKLAIVTGNSRGIGKAISDSLRKEGVEVPEISRASGYNLMRNLYQVQKDYEKCDILINNVGGGGRWGTDPLKFNEWDDVMYKNMGIAREMTLHYLPGMINKKWGRVITISSIYGKEGGGKPWFSMAKASQIAFMKDMAKQGYEGITFNSVCPGYIDVANRELNKDGDGISDNYEVADGTPPFEFVKGITYGEPEDVANLVTFLCSNKARFINGAAITCDGGLSNSF